MFVPPSDLRKYILLLIGCAVLCGGRIQAQIDDNTNGMDDIWEVANGVNVAADDPDGDGQKNLQESIAGTDPKNALSVLKTNSFELSEGVGGDLVHFSWPTVAGKKYQVQVASEMGKWQDVSDAVIGDGNEKEVNFSLNTTFLFGKIPDSRWSLATGEGLAKIKANVAGNVEPTIFSPITSFNIPQTSPNVDNFGHWIRGWLIPPTTGSYQFWISSDDTSELWLSTTDSAANAVKIAYLGGATAYQQWDKYPLTQGSASINLTANTPYYIEAYQAEETGFDHLSVAWTGPGFASKTIIAGKYLATSPKPLSALMSGNPSLFFHVAVTDMDSDGDGIPDADEILIGYNPYSANTKLHISDTTALRLATSAKNIITVGAAPSLAYENPLIPGRFTIFRSGNLGPLTISYAIMGTAKNGIDYQKLSGTVNLAVVQNSATIDVTPILDTEIEPQETVTLQILPGTNYTVGSPSNATVTLDDAPGALYVANLRPDPGVQSGGYGTAFLNVEGNQEFATLKVTFSNLNAAQVRTEIYISDDSLTGQNIFGFIPGQVPDTRLDLVSNPEITKEELLSALQNGLVYARVISDAFPNGEISGELLLSSGWQEMPTPPDPGVLPTDILTQSEAARFLTQATYGPTRASINELVAQGSYDGWINAQFSLPPTLHLPYVQARRIELLARSTTKSDGYWRPLQEAWWENAIRAPDQLRQRMAFALSQIFVISETGGLALAHEGVANYYDLLATHAFGNFRTLLKDVTLSPMMGTYLSMLKNQKPNVFSGSQPDENYAREVMQLFTIGLNQLNLDGSLLLGNDGLPIPAYTQSDIVGLAHVFTGWSYPTPAGQITNFLYGTHDDINPMVSYDAYHDMAQKRIVGNTLLPAGQTAAQDLEQAINTLFNHPNVGPFIARQLIQRLVTSNPSPGYIYRVASVFNDNGAGVRGDLQATLRAILLDYEARSSSLLTHHSFGKQREPVIRMAHLFRAMSINPPLATDNRLFLDMENMLISQVPLHSPSVFNFFQPGYTPPGPLVAAGVYAPEFQITSEPNVINQMNIQRTALLGGIYTPEAIAPSTGSYAAFDFAALLTIINSGGYTALQNQQALLDELSVLLLNGRMSAGLRAEITKAFAELPATYVSTNPIYQKYRIRIAIYLIFASPEYVIQK